MKLSSLVGALVDICPNDTSSKSGIIEDITDQGILFKITDADNRRSFAYKKGTYHFISFSASLSFKVIRTPEQQEGKEPE